MYTLKYLDIQAQTYTTITKIQHFLSTIKEGLWGLPDPFWDFESVHTYKDLQKGCFAL